MPETKANQSEQTRQASQTIARENQPRRGLRRWESSAPLSFTSPFELMDRMTEEMDHVFDRMFEGFGLPRRSSFARDFGSLSPAVGWAPRIEAFQKGDRFIVHADLPGLKKDDVQVELTEEALTIHGERREEHEEEREGYFHSEREYGQFHRTIPLPQGVISESAQASFKNGVLEISMQAAPAEANRGRRVEIKDESETSSGKNRHVSR